MSVLLYRFKAIMSTTNSLRSILLPSKSNLLSQYYFHLWSTGICFCFINHLCISVFIHLSPSSLEFWCCFFNWCIGLAFYYRWTMHFVYRIVEQSLYFDYSHLLCFRWLNEYYVSSTFKPDIHSFTHLITCI